MSWMFLEMRRVVNYVRTYIRTRGQCGSSPPSFFPRISLSYTSMLCRLWCYRGTIFSLMRDRKYIMDTFTNWLCLIAATGGPFLLMCLFNPRFCCREYKVFFSPFPFPPFPSLPSPSFSPSFSPSSSPFFIPFTAYQSPLSFSPSPSPLAFPFHHSLPSPLFPFAKKASKKKQPKHLPHQITVLLTKLIVRLLRLRLYPGWAERGMVLSFQI